MLIKSFRTNTLIISYYPDPLIFHIFSYLINQKKNKDKSHNEEVLDQQNS
jgi:hypothetical protein